MTPKEQAIKLLENYNNLDKTKYTYINAKHYALLSVENMLDWYSDEYEISANGKLKYKFWKQVQKEIEKL